jgi:choice-of-anchor A domain-containing protein
MRKRFVRQLGLLFRRQPLVSIARSAAVVALVLLCTAATHASVIGLGGAGDYDVLGIGGSSVSIRSDFEVYQSATVVNGNVGMGPYSDWGHTIDATINGRVDYDLTDSGPTVTGTVTGGVHQINMAPIVADARNASILAAAFAPTQTFATLTSGQTITGSGGMNVIRVTGDVGLSGGSTTLTLSGGPSDQFLFQLTALDAPSAHTLTLSGVTMFLAGGVTPGNILWDMHGNGGGIVISSGATVYGTFLAPDRGIEVDHGNIIGAVIGGGGADSHSDTVSVHSSSNITIPEPGAASLLALAGLITVARRRRRA